MAGKTLVAVCLLVVCLVARECAAERDFAASRHVAPLIPAVITTTEKRFAETANPLADVVKSIVGDMPAAAQDNPDDIPISVDSQLDISKLDQLSDPSLLRALEGEAGASASAHHAVPSTLAQAEMNIDRELTLKDVERSFASEKSVGKAGVDKDDEDTDHLTGAGPSSETKADKLEDPDTTEEKEMEREMGELNRLITHGQEIQKMLPEKMSRLDELKRRFAAKQAEVKRKKAQKKYSEYAAQLSTLNGVIQQVESKARLLQEKRRLLEEKMNQEKAIIDAPLSDATPAPTPAPATHTASPVPSTTAFEEDEEEEDYDD